MLHLLYGTETGTTEELAEETGPLAEERGLDVVVMDLDDLTMEDFVDVRDALFLVSTAGDGDMPYTAEQFWLDISRAKTPPLPQLRYGVLALGDTSYSFFCAAGKKIDAQLEALGATRVLERQDCDVDYETQARAWLSTALDYFVEHPRTD
ncbi:flavodoxin domain-containing protein [Citricoccus sp. NR2]|uniref:flavodoxin domain-containing protein n=1 Tax=Citricoccus sp. NR2 TaxID=3004095 RepID=UPI0022DE5660|nr:flavodoxin domain-containing protein [Citricoccus sp. NR2]WBL19555.1 flavodoxin domain-containing protein [Citricoccus sp. NR2]